MYTNVTNILHSNECQAEHFYFAPGRDTIAHILEHVPKTSKLSRSDITQHHNCDEKPLSYLYTAIASSAAPGDNITLSSHVCSTIHHSLWSRRAYRRPANWDSKLNIDLELHTDPFMARRTLIPVNEPLKNKTLQFSITSEYHVISKVVTFKDPIYSNLSEIANFDGVWKCRHKTSTIIVYIDTKGVLPLANRYPSFGQHLHYILAEDAISLDDISFLISDVARYNESAIPGVLFTVVRFFSTNNEWTNHCHPKLLKDINDLEKNPANCTKRERIKEYLLDLLPRLCRHVTPSEGSALPQLEVGDLVRMTWIYWFQMWKEGDKGHDEQSKKERQTSRKFATSDLSVDGYKYLDGTRIIAISETRYVSVYCEMHFSNNNKYCSNSLHVISHKVTIALQNSIMN